MNSIKQSKQHLVNRTCDTHTVEHEVKKGKLLVQNKKWERKNNILYSNTCTWLWSKSGEWNSEKKKHTHNAHKTPNEIVRSQRQLSVNCPTPQAIKNCSFVLLVYKNLKKNRAVTTEEGMQKIGMSDGTKSCKSEAIWNGFDVWFNVFSLWLWTRKQHQPNLRIGRNWQRKIIE